MKSNKLLNVTDDRTNEGFNDGNKYRGTSIGDAGNDYDYDLNGNLTQDLNKEITKISYNDLNLPVEVHWNASKKINYVYDASGVKLRKILTNGTVVTTTDYAGGFQYKDKSLQFFPTSEGYVNVTDGTAFNYVYNYTDHLGNVRLSYQKETNGTLKILEENNYYPFGLKHSGYDDGKLGNQTYNYKYNGKEWQGKDDLDINLYDYGARNYDPAIGRFFNIDPMADERTWVSPFNYVQNNPLSRVDPTGMLDGWIEYEDEGQRTVEYRADIDTKEQAEAAGYENVSKVFEQGHVASTGGNFETYNLNSDGTITQEYFFGIFNLDTTKNINAGDVTMKGIFNGYQGPGSISAPSFSYFDRWDHQVAMGLWQGGAEMAVGGAINQSLKGVQRAANYASEWKTMSSGLPKNGKFQYGIRNINTNYQLRIERHRLQTANGGELGTHINYGIGGKKHYFPFNSSRYTPYVKE